MAAIDHARTRLAFGLAMLNGKTASWTAPRHADLYSERMNGIKCAPAEVVQFRHFVDLFKASHIKYVNYDIDLFKLNAHNYLSVAASHDWLSLTRLTGGAPFEVERVRLTGQDVTVEGRFELPALAQLPAEDQTFVAAFVRCHGSIKQMEKLFGVSYPTIKNRLNRIGALLPFPEVDPEPEPDRPSRATLISQLERGELTVDDVVRQLRREEEK